MHNTESIQNQITPITWYNKYMVTWNTCVWCKSSTQTYNSQCNCTHHLRHIIRNQVTAVNKAMPQSIVYQQGLEFHSMSTSGELINCSTTCSNKLRCDTTRVILRSWTTADEGSHSSSTSLARSAKRTSLLTYISKGKCKAVPVLN